MTESRFSAAGLSEWRRKLEEKPAYEERIIAFYDVLGWRQKIKEAGSDPDLIHQLAILINAFAMLAALEKTDAESKIRISTFSDNVVVSESIEHANFTVFLVRLGFVQLFAATNGFLIRGGVTIGHIKHDDSSVFGPGLNRAYEIESKHAHFPRIMLDPEIIPRLGAVECVAVEEGVHFIDAFTPLFIRLVSLMERAQGVDPEKANIQSMVNDVVNCLHLELLKPLRRKDMRKVEWLYDRLCKNFGSAHNANAYRKLVSKGRAKR